MQNFLSLKESDIEELKSMLDGSIIYPDDSRYEELRKVWNGMINKKPALIIKCHNPVHVQQTVLFARKHNILVSVRSGGHNVAGNAVCEGGLMIDLSSMRHIEVDPETRIATAEAGATWRELDTATQLHGLATTGGTVSDTGIAGLTLGGGIGWLMSLYGATCDNLIAAEIITANGDILHTDPENHPDLFWAIRGGGGNFGIVTKFTYKLHPVEPSIKAGMLLYPMEQAKQVMQFYRQFARTAPDELMTYAGFMVTPDGFPVTFILPAWLGSLEKAGEILRPLRSFGAPIADLVTEMSYLQLQSLLDGAAPKGLRRYWKSGYFTELTDELIEIYIRNIATRTSPLSAVLFFHIRGAITRIDPNANAFSHRQDQWDSDIISQWVDTEDDSRHISWTRKFWNEVEPFTKGVYVNHLDSDDKSRVKNAYGIHYGRLQEIKGKYDPGNFFRLNNNILPL